MRNPWIALCLPVLLAAQNPPVTFHSDVRLVTVTATITDRAGRYVQGVRQDEVSVLEDGVRQQIALFRDEAEPISLGIVFDTSGSMQNKILNVIDAVTHFGATAQPEDDIFLMRFSSRVELVLDFTANRDLLSSAAGKLRANGATVLYDAVTDALEKVQTGRHHKKALVAITDGEDTHSRTKFKELLEMARDAEVLIYCVGLGTTDQHGKHARGRDTVDMTVLNDLAEAGGARAYQIMTSNARIIDATVQEISAELRQQYTIGYYPSNKARDGGYRRIQVTTANPGYQVRARRGYNSPRVE